MTAVDSARGLPLTVMGDLIELAQDKEDVRAHLIQVTKDYFGDGVDDLTVAKYALICGELGQGGLEAVSYGFGHEDGDLGHRAKSETLTRHADIGLGVLIAAVHETDEPEIRGMLCECIYGALFPGSPQILERVRLFALERWAVEKAGRREDRHWDAFKGALGLMHGTRVSGVADRLAEAKRLLNMTGYDDTEMDDFLAGDDEGMFAVARGDRARDWRAAAQYLGEAFDCPVLK